MKTITVTTKYLPPTNTLGARIVASTPDDANRRLVTGWRHYFNPDENHENAALNLIGKRGLVPPGLSVTLIASALLRKSVQVHIYAPTSLPDRTRRA
jgi:hypothetical protein